MPQPQRAGRDVEKVLQRYFFKFAIHDEKLQYGLVIYKVSLPLPR
jgi:hypothetical protein